MPNVRRITLPGGHKLNSAVLRRLLADKSAYQIVEATRRERGRSAEIAAARAPAHAPWTR